MRLERYAASDVERFQLSQIPYKGIWKAANMKLWIESETIDGQDGKVDKSLYI